MSSYANPMFMPPEEAYADYQAGQLSLTEYCDLGIPWNCRWYGFPGLTDLLAPGTKRPCAEAWDLYDACVGGSFNRNLAPASGAGKASPVAAQPGVNYNDPAVLQAISEAQKKSDLAKWLETIGANQKLMTGAPGEPAAEFPWGLLLVGVAVFAIFILAVKN